MKTLKRFLMLILLLLPALLLPGLRAAAESPAAAGEGSGTVRIIDKAGIWSAATESEYEQEAAELAEQYGTDVVLLSVRALQDASTGDRFFATASAFAEAYYNMNGYGSGEDRSGMLFLFCKEPGNLQYAFYAAGREAESYGTEDTAYLKDEIRPYLEGGDYDGAARRYLELAKTHEANGRFDGNRVKADSSNYLWTFGLALLVAWAITSSMKRRMRPVQEASAARTYTVRNSFELRRYNEIYLGTTVSKQPRNQNRQPGR